MHLCRTQKKLKYKLSYKESMFSSVLRGETKWVPESWRAFHDEHMPKYNSQLSVYSVIEQLKLKQGVFKASDVIGFQNKLATTSNPFYLFMGDCCELFEYCNADRINSFLEMFNSIKSLFSNSGVTPLFLWRAAGQYAKPRSKLVEKVSGLELPVYQGDIVNGFEFSEDSRAANPDLMLKAYNVCDEFHGISSSLLRLSFNSLLDSLFFCHEAFLLPWEEGLVRSFNGNYYSSSAHLLWIGERTRGISSAHVEFLRGVINPIGIKVGSACNISELKLIIQKINPSNVNKKCFLFTRLGAKNVDAELPTIISAISEAGLNVEWICDPMHGNGTVTKNGTKTRHIDDIIYEWNTTDSIFRHMGVKLSGVHLEVSPNFVTECIGGEPFVSESSLSSCYTSRVDPRLNKLQAINILKKYVVPSIL